MAWKAVPGYEGFYEVSDEGEIRNWSTWKKLTPRACKKTGSLRVNLPMDGVLKTLPVHRIVAEVFVPNPDGFKNVKHKDGNKKNNTVENLYWSRAKKPKKELEVNV